MSADVIPVLCAHGSLPDSCRESWQEDDRGVTAHNALSAHTREDSPDPLTAHSALSAQPRTGSVRHPSLPTLDPAAWHGPAADYALRLAPLTEADPLAVYCMVLAGLGHRIGPDTYAVLGADRHPPLLWLLAVGRTATGRKGTADGVSLGVLGEVGGLVRRRTGLSSGEGLLDALAPDDEDTADPRLLVVESEWEAPLARSRREGSSLSAVLRDAWDGRPLATMTVNRREVPRHHVTVVGHVTPSALREGMGDREASNGFLNRFLVLGVRRPRPLPFPEPVPADALDLLRGMVDTVRQHRPGMRSMTPAAREWYGERYLRTERVRESLPERVANVTARGPGHLLRLALILSVIDGADGIGVEHVTAAAAVVDYSAACVWRIYGPGLTGTDGRVLDALASAHPEPLSRNALRDALSRHVSAGDLTAALSTLTTAGLVVAGDDRATGGRPRSLFTVTREGLRVCAESAESAVSADTDDEDPE